MAPLDELARGNAANAIVGWLLTGIVALASVRSVVANAHLWGGLASLVVVVTVLPPAATRNWTVMVPWPLPLFAAAAALLGAFGLYPEIAGYLAVATLALVAVVELDAFTAIEMSRRFAVGFAVLTTLAVQGIWTIAQYYSDRWLGTEFLRSQTELQVDIVAVTVVGMAMGAVFFRYFERVDHAGSKEHQGESSGGR